MLNGTDGAGITEQPIHLDGCDDGIPICPVLYETTPQNTIIPMYVLNLFITVFLAV
jgi:hypothetical protein